MENFQNNLERSILAVIAYFDIFDYPLTLVELWKWLYHPETAGTIWEVQKNIELSEKIKSFIETRRGFYFLRGRDLLVPLRQSRYNLAEKKIKKAVRIARFLKMIPGVRMIAVCNSLAWTNAREESDIDFFIVTAKQKIWIVRFWAAGVLKLLGLRPREGKVKDKICLSFFADEENLNFEKISLAEPDIYLIYWIAHIVPLYDAGGVYQRFLGANAWIKKYLPNFLGTEMSERRRLGRRSLPTWLGVGEKFFRRLELMAMPDKIKKMANRDSRVVVSDSMLKFHVNDRREEYKKKWEEKIGKMLNG